MPIVRKDGTIDIKIIQPGKGSSGYYPADVLKRDGSVFKSGTKMFWDHQTAQEEAAKPEGALNNLAAALIEDARWEDVGAQGAGLYAKAKVFGGYKETLNEIGAHIGVSIRASGTSSVKDVAGFGAIPVVEAITRAKSIDFVTIPGAGGRILELFESAKRHTSLQESNALSTEELDMPIDEKLFQEVQAQNRALVEQVSQLQQYNMRNDASKVIHATLANYPTLAASTRKRIADLAESYTPPVDSTTGALDAVKLVESVKNAISAEMAYLSSLGAGQVRGLGASAPIPEADAAKYTYDAFRESLKTA